MCVERLRAGLPVARRCAGCGTEGHSAPSYFCPLRKGQGVKAAVPRAAPVQEVLISQQTNEASSSAGESAASPDGDDEATESSRHSNNNDWTSHGTDVESDEQLTERPVMAEASVQTSEIIQPTILTETSQADAECQTDDSFFIYDDLRLHIFYPDSEDTGVTIPTLLKEYTQSMMALQSLACLTFKPKEISNIYFTKNEAFDRSHRDVTDRHRRIARRRSRSFHDRRRAREGEDSTSATLSPPATPEPQ